MATMRRVAALAGVSLKTVSRVVNGLSSVDRALAARVRRAATQLNYRHNMTANNLRRGDHRSFVIGPMFEDVGNPYSARLRRDPREWLAGGSGVAPPASIAVRGGYGPATAISVPELNRVMEGDVDTVPGGAICASYQPGVPS